MIEVKGNFNGGLDLDTSLDKVAQDSYVDALNVTRDSDIEGVGKGIVNLLGNLKVPYTLPAGVNKCVGSVSNNSRNTLVYFVSNSLGNHSILEYSSDTNTITKIFLNLTDSEEDILFFTDKKIYAKILVREEGDLLYFLDGNGKPSKLNISDFKSGKYPVVTKDVINVHKRPPLRPIYAAYSNDATRRANSLRKRLFRFKYRWGYYDFEKSTTSPISEIPYPFNILDDTYTNVITNNNVITMVAQSGGKDVKSVEILMSYVQENNDWSDFLLVESLNKTERSISDEVPFEYNFYNDGTYAPININDSLLLHDFVPDSAKDLELINGNVVGLANIEDGYSRDLEADVEVDVLTYPVGLGGGGSLVATEVAAGFPYNKQLLFSGVPEVGTGIIIKLRRTSDSAVINTLTYTTNLVVIGGSTSIAVAKGLAYTFGSIISGTYLGGSGLGLTISSGYTFELVEIVSPAFSQNTNSIPTFPFSEEKRLALVYFDREGKTPGVVYDTKVTFPAYAEDGTEAVLLPYINPKIFHVPPIWAWSYQWLLTKTANNFIYWYTVDVNTSETNYIYFDISSFNENSLKNPATSKVLNYQFKEGDRVRLIKRDSDNFIFNDTFDAPIVGVVTDPTISGTLKKGLFLKIKKVAPLTGVDYTSKFFTIKIYSPTQQSANADKQVFFEIGEQFPIINPNTAGRVHGGQFAAQDIGGGVPAQTTIYYGDVYFRKRTINITSSGIATFNVIDPNFVDTYISAVHNIDGRANVIDLDAKKNFFRSIVRFSLAYQPDTNINETNRFFPNNYEVADLTYGGIGRIKTRDRQLTVYQEFKVGRMPLFSEIRKNANGQALQVVTDRLLNPIGYYAGDYGIGDSPESLASFNFAEYFCDNNSGVICRLSSDGITPISIVYKVNSFAKKTLPLYGKDNAIHTICDPTKAGKYVMSFQPISEDGGATLVFSENEKSFDGFVSFVPEMYGVINDLMIAFKNGELWTFNNPTFNNFFGVQFDSVFTPVFNAQPLMKKQPMILKEISNVVWECPKIVTNVESYSGVLQETDLVETDFEKIEGEHTAAILCDKNSIGGINNGDFMKGKYCKIKFRKENATELVTLSIISLDWNNSPNNK